MRCRWWPCAPGRSARQAPRRPSSVDHPDPRSPAGLHGEGCWLGRIRVRHAQELAVFHRSSFRHAGSLAACRSSPPVEDTQRRRNGDGERSFFSGSGYWIRARWLIGAIARHRGLCRLAPSHAPHGGDAAFRDRLVGLLSIPSCPDRHAGIHTAAWAHVLDGWTKDRHVHHRSVPCCRPPFFFLGHLIAWLSGGAHGWIHAPYAITKHRGDHRLPLHSAAILCSASSNVGSPPQIAFFTVLLLYAGTNLFYYSSYEQGMSHVYSFFLFGWLLHSRNDPSRRSHRGGSSVSLFVVR
jgi:hypothetical protein